MLTFSSRYRTDKLAWVTSHCRARCGRGTVRACIPPSTAASVAVAAEGEQASRRAAVSLAVQPDESQDEQHGPEQVVEEGGGSATTREEGEAPAVLHGKSGQPDPQRDEHRTHWIGQEKSGDDAQGTGNRAHREGGARSRRMSRRRQRSFGSPLKRTRSGSVARPREALMTTV